jgi:hypothetical protein
MSRHTHFPVSISLRGKTDSVDIECQCGALEAFAVWHTEMPKGWSKRVWWPTMQAARALLNARQEFNRVPRIERYFTHRP